MILILGGGFFGTTAVASTNADANGFGAFEYAVPTLSGVNYYTLCTKNERSLDNGYITFQPSDYFNTKLYTGNAGTNAQAGVGFQPDFTLD